MSSNINHVPDQMRNSTPWNSAAASVSLSDGVLD